MKRLFLLSLLNITFLLLNAQKLPLRTELSLNGEWNFTPKDGTASLIKVPDYWDAKPEWRQVDNAVYERKVFIPDVEEWKNKLIKLEFEGVNFITDVYINNELVTSHIGGWIPFSADITPFVKPGNSYSLKVHVKGGNHSPIVDKDGIPQWPVGFFGQDGKWGIIFDVWLRAFGETYIEDAFIQTSVRNKTIRVDYQLKNPGSIKRKVRLKARIVSANDIEKTVLNLESSDLAIKSEKGKSLSLNIEWNDPHLWSPGDPFLYYLETKLIDDGTGEIIDKELRRFGFREVWVEGPKLMLNGQRLTLLGANIVQHSEFFNNQNYYYLSPESWNRTIDRLFELNLRMVRFHMQPAPRYLLDIADERGLLIMEESTIYAREFVLDMNKEAYLKNCYTWIKPWVIDRRNHPSVILWNVENEMGVGWLKWMTSKEMKSLGDEVRKYDKTRPVNYDGDRDVGDQMVNLHYPEVYKGTVNGSIYSWADSLHPEKPTGVGEFLTHYGENGLVNQWWMGTFVRGMRYVYFSDIRPYRHDWAILREDNTECIDNLSRSLSPVALFDKEYDDLGLLPLLYKNYPIMMEGDTLQRELVLYNDEFADTVISIEILVRSTDTHQALYDYNGNQTPISRVVAQASQTYFVPLGEHVDIPYSLIVPSIHEGFLGRIEIDLIARKKGEIKFKETLKFALRGLKPPDKVEHSKASVSLFNAEAPDYPGR